MFTSIKVLLEFPKEKDEDETGSIYDKRIACFSKLSADPVNYRETFNQCEHIIKPHGKPYNPWFPSNNRTKCFERLINNQKTTKYTDNEYITVSIYEGGHNNGEKRLAGLQEEYRVNYMQCAAAIQPK
jgi:hypothetical protein